MAHDRGRFLPIARIHRARETILEQAARAQKSVLHRAESALVVAREEVDVARASIAELATCRCLKRTIGVDDLARFDLSMIAACALRDEALARVDVASAQLVTEQEIYRQLMKKLMREHEFVDAAMKQHRIESRRNQQKIELASEEAISDSLRPIGLAALSF